MLCECVPDWKVLHRPLSVHRPRMLMRPLCPWLLLAWSHSRDPRDPSIVSWLTEGNIRAACAPHAHTSICLLLFILFAPHLGKVRERERGLSLNIKLGMRARLFCREIYLGGKCTFINTPPQRVSTKPHAAAGSHTVCVFMTWAFQSYETANSAGNFVWAANFEVKIEKNASC